MFIFSNDASIGAVGFVLSKLQQNPAKFKELLVQAENQKQLSTHNKKEINQNSLIELNQLKDFLVNNRDLDKSEIFSLIKNYTLKTIKENKIKIQYSDILEIRAAIEHTVKNINKSNANETVFKTHYLTVHNSLDELINFYFRKETQNGKRLL